MASYKDTFESKTFGANTFAAGAWRGTGATVTLPWGNVVYCQSTNPRLSVSTFNSRLDVASQQPIIPVETANERIEGKSANRRLP